MKKPQQTRTLDEMLDECLYLHHALLKLGFDPGEINMVVDKGGDAVAIELVAQGRTVTLNFATKFQRTTVGAIRARWRQKIAWWNAHPWDEELAEGWKTSYACRHGYEICIALLRKGFSFRAVRNPPKVHSGSKDLLN